MLDVFSRAVSEADARGIFLSNKQIDELQALASNGAARLKVVNLMTENASNIVASSARNLFAEKPQLISPGGTAYTNHQVACCLRDLEIILRYVTYAMFAGDSSVLNDRCLNGLRETYIALGISGSSIAAGIQKLKEATLKLLIEPQMQKEKRDLALPIIRKLYPRQWVTIQVTEFKDGFPWRGKVLYYDSDISRVSARKIPQ